MIEYAIFLICCVLVTAGWCFWFAFSRLVPQAYERGQQHLIADTRAITAARAKAERMAYSGICEGGPIDGHAFLIQPHQKSALFFRPDGTLSCAYARAFRADRKGNHVFTYVPEA